MLPGVSRRGEESAAVFAVSFYDVFTFVLQVGGVAAGLTLIAWLCVGGEA